MVSWLSWTGIRIPAMMICLPLVPLLLVVVMVLLYAYVSSESHTSGRKLPPGPFPWPIIGNLHQLGRIPHQTLAQLSKQYGPLLYLRLGSMPAVVVSNASLAKEFLLTHDKIFANRAGFEFCKRMLYGNDNGVAFTRYGPRWRQMRKICTLELFSTKRLQDFQHVRIEEITLMLEELENLSQEGRQAIDIGKIVGILTSNIMGRLLLTRRLSECGEAGASLQDIYNEMTDVSGATVLGDFIPYLGWLDLKTKRLMDHVHNRIDKFCEGVLDERQRDRQENPRNTPNDFLDVLLSNDISSEVGGLGKDNLKATLMDILGAGTETSAITVEWAMAELLRSPLTLMKLQDEIDTVVGRGRRVEESDLTHLTYLQAVIKETFRLHPPVPLLIPRASIEACNVGKYTLPENTRLFVNAWAIGRDPEIWEKSEEFWPERFKVVNIDLRGQHFELLPFGSGRRSCPGISLGLSVVELTVSNLVHCFDWELPAGETPTNLDMTDKSSITVRKAKPLLAIPKPRRTQNTT